MYKLRFLLISAAFLGCFSNGWVLAQTEEEERTEASVPEDEEGYLDDVAPRTMLKDQRVLDYEPVREADVVWQKRIWRVIDVREKMNVPFIYPVRPLFKILVEAAQNGDIKIFKEDNFKKFLSGDDLRKMLYSIDTIPIWNPDTYTEEIKIIENEIDYNDIKTYRIKEMWYFDKEISRVKVRILGIAPIRDELDDFGNVKYTLPMFWIYYPEARKYLSREQVFNEKNDAAPGTWADVFDSYFFSSYIIKESNVQDLRLIDIYKEVDENGNNIPLLLESERIKNELLNFEHDLWVY